jgi:hypothetical protein
MIQLLASALSIAATLFVVGTALYAAAVHLGRAGEYERLTGQLPDACRLQNLRVQVQQVSDELGGLRAELAEARYVIAERERAERWLDENRDVLHRVEVERKYQESLRLELEELRQKLESEAGTLKDLLKEKDATEIRGGALKVQLKELNELLVRRQEQEKELDRRIRDLESRRAPIESQVELLEKRLASARLELEAAEHSHHDVVQDLQAQQVRLEEVRREHARLTAEIAGREEYRKEIEKAVDQVKERLVEAREAAGEDDRLRLAELWQPALSPAPVFEEASVKERDGITSTLEHFDGLGLRFHDRVILAFHTSLKVADESPLVVLAGISGTGKSELPRRYSDAMGMHFLNIAVQPRWDSPQDMFGFYNYMEGRYRATELARALVQMDPCYAEEGRGWLRPDESDWTSLSDQMLLVLIDEMNLARVEYYFSEFLSRLEVRRGVDRRDPHDRRKAEIPLEVGLRSAVHAKGNGKPALSPRPTMQLFVDTNVLFVGTMNEDESTQALSDKVIDRSNLLRFGKPARLSDNSPSKVPTKGRTARIGNRRRIPYETWRSWIKPVHSLSSPIAGEVDRWIAELNEAMALIHRPFAHRTYRSIRSYVANYPDLGEHPYRNAMADQVEQKILPKFRGLDLHDPTVKQAINRTVDVVKDLGDDALIHSIEGARRNKDQLFAWQGVDRGE